MVIRQSFSAVLAFVALSAAVWPGAALADRAGYAGSAYDSPDGAEAIGVEVLDPRGRPLADYPLEQRGRTYRAYLQAERGESYAIAVSNHSDRRIGVVVAVDGRNIIDGRRSQLDASERMYILAPRERAVYRGWRTGRDRVNRFYFTDAGDSYSAAWGDDSAMGVIAVAAFEARESRPRPQPYSGPRDRRGAEKYGHAPSLRAEPGTGFGEQEWSPSRQVAFQPRRRPFARHFLKYEWRDTLCERGVIECRRSHPRHTENRFWRDDTRRGWADGGFSPYPPHRPRLRW